MRSSLDEPTGFLDRPSNTTDRIDAAGNIRYVLRNGVTLALPWSQDSETDRLADEGGVSESFPISQPLPKLDQLDPITTSEGKCGADAALLWQRLPRHIRLLAGMADRQEEEAAQKYYTRDFKESRGQLFERLLDPTLTLEDTARVLGVVPATVRRYTNRGVLRHYRTVGRQRRFRLSDVLAFFESQQDRKADVLAEDEALVNA